MKRGGFCGMLLALWWLPLHAQAPEPDVTVDAWIGTPAVAVGERIDLHVRVASPSGTEVRAPEIAGRHGPFDVLAVQTTREEQHGVWSRKWLVHLTTFERGSVTIPSLTFHVSSGDTSTMHQTPTLDVAITRPHVESTADLRPLRPPLPTPTGPWRRMWQIVAILVAVSLLGLAAMASSMRVRIRLSSQSHATATDPIARLQAMARHLPATDAEIADFYIALSTVMREVVHASLDVRAAHLSTTELMDLLGRQPRAVPVLDDLARLLRTADRVKFAGWRPLDAAVHRAELRRAGRIVQTVRS